MKHFMKHKLPLQDNCNILKSQTHVLLVLLWRHFVSTILCPKRLNSANSVYKYIFVDIYTHILTYIHIWTYIKYIKYYIIRVYCTRQRSVDYHPPFTDSNDCHQQNPNAGLRLTFSWPIFWIRSYGNVPMVRGIISCFRRKTWFCWQNVTKKILRVDFPLFKLMYRCKVPSSARWSKAFIFLRKALIFRRKAFISWRLPLWRYGGLDSANSANKVA